MVDKLEQQIWLYLGLRDDMRAFKENQGGRISNAQYRIIHGRLLRRAAPIIGKRAVYDILAEVH